MSSLREDYALLLAGADQIELDLARSLLEGAGIPSLRVAPNEFAEDTIHFPPVGVGNLYVSKADQERAIAVLDEAWGHGWKERR